MRGSNGFEDALLTVAKLEYVVSADQLTFSTNCGQLLDYAVVENFIPEVIALADKRDMCPAKIRPSAAASSMLGPDAVAAMHP